MGSHISFLKYMYANPTLRGNWMHVTVNFTAIAKHQHVGVPITRHNILVPTW